MRGLYVCLEVLMSVPPTRPDLEITSSNWPFSGHFGSLSVQSWFSGQNSQFAGQILFCPDCSVGHFSIDITHFSINLQYCYEIFHIFKDK